MSDEFSFAAPAFEIDPKTGGEDYEWRRRPPATGRHPGGGYRPPPKASRPRPFPQARRLGPGPMVDGRPGMIFPEPFSVEPVASPEPAGSERVRWVQDCLNQALGMQLPVTGVMGPETRSAVRAFQRQKSLRVSGIAGPDTEEALRRACVGQASNPAGDSGGPDESELGPLTAKVTWLPNNQNPALLTREEAGRQSGGGVYIVVESADGRTIGRILKVGRTHRFGSRFGTKDPFYGRPLALKRGHAIIETVPAERLRFYLGRLDRFVDPTINIERALARLLSRTGETLAGGINVPSSQVLGRVEITHILPKPMRDRLPQAYRARGAGIPEGTPPVPIIENTLILEPGAFPKWEVPQTPAASFAGGTISNQETTRHGTNCRCPHCRIAGETAFESPFSEAEEMELAAELLSIASEEELDQFLGKMFKGIARGIGKFGKFVGRRILKPLGGVLKTIAKKALPFVGGALGSLIPIPGVGTALGSALGGAVGKALEAEVAGLSPELREFEMARRFVRLAGTAARQAVLAPPEAGEGEILEMAILGAARRHLPNLPAQAAVSGGGTPSGRWLRRGGSILVLGT